MITTFPSNATLKLTAAESTMQDASLHLRAPIRICSQRIVERSSSIRTLERRRIIITAIQLFHFHSVHSIVRGAASVLRSALLTEPLVTVIIPRLELHVGRRPRSAKDREPVIEHVDLAEGAMSILFHELVGVQVFSSRLASCCEKEVVATKTGWIGYNQDGVYEHGKRDPPVIDCSAE